ncbi:chemotaxis protein CheC [Desulfitispora alkaliphila]|uniref:chemotaxis protein CheC n=1 Tax=Desulfitispora alkaliphila TaxID=622674 RepID=UPI003D228183
MIKLSELNNLQLDALKEVGNIGAGNAATALSQLLQKKIDMEVPRVKVLPLEEIPEVMGGSEILVTGVYLKVEGKAPCNILFIMPVESAQALTNTLLGRSDDEVEFDEMSQSALMEIGNILAGSYLNSLASFTFMSFSPSVPALAQDMAGAIISAVVFDLGEIADHCIVIETKFFEGERDISGHFFLLPEPDSLELILNSLGVSS